MRLTLRNMLNYMDDVLEPADSQDISKKIEESEFATSLMHRIRDVTRRLRMAAPKVDGRGIGLDPNTVAEYLDNTLTTERVADFEKVCLESDMHLAEVASCHQVLALVLGEPAEIDPVLRQRMYALGTTNPAPKVASGHGLPVHDQHSVAAETVSIVTAGPQSSAGQKMGEAAEHRPLRKKPEVPDYLREPTKSRGRGWAIAAAILLAIIAGGTYQAYQLGTFDEFLSPSELAQAPGDETGKTGGKEQTTSNSKATTGINLTSGRPGQPGTPAGQGAAGQTAIVQPAASAPGAGQPAANPAVGNQPPGGPTTAAPAVGNVAAGALATGTPAPGTPAMIPNAPAPAGAAPEGELKQPSSQTAMTSDRPAGAASPTASTAPEPPKPAKPAPGGPAPAGVLANDALAAAPLTPEGLGRLISEREVLLRFDRQSQAWVRLTTRATVYPGDRLLSLPTYRSNLTLTAGVSVQLLGGTLIELLAPDSHGVPGMRLLDGRAILLTFGKPGAQLKLWSGNRQGVVTFADPDSTLAAEVVRMRPDGANPEKEPATVAVNLYATAGATAWFDEMHLQPQPLQAPALLTYGATNDAPVIETTTPEQFPVWIKTDERPAMEKRASVAVEEALEPDRPISLGLKELAGDRRSEVSSLAVQCLAEIDEFESVVNALNDPGQRAAWNALIDSLRTAIARSPATAAKVRQAFEHHRGPKGDELYRMLWGYSPDQLQTGGAGQLVKYMDHDDLDFRELAFWNLTRLAGPSGHFYRPTDTAAKRQPAMRAWKQKLDSGALNGKPLEK